MKIKIRENKSSRKLILAKINPNKVAWNSENPYNFHTKPIFGKTDFATVSEANIWFSHFKFNLLEGDMVSFLPRLAYFRPGEWEVKFWLTLYLICLCIFK